VLDRRHLRKQFLWASLLLSPICMEAATSTWTGLNSGIDSWNTGGNWTPAMVPGLTSAGTAGNDVLFSSLAGLTIDLDGGPFTIGSLAITSSGTNTFSTGSLIFSSPATTPFIALTGSGGGTVQIDTLVGVTSAQVLTISINAGSGSLTFAGGMNGPGSILLNSSCTFLPPTVVTPYAANIAIATGQTLILNATGGNITVNGALVGNGALQLMGAGSCFLNGLSTFTGGTTMSGTVSLQGPVAAVQGNINTGTSGASVIFAEPHSGTYSSAITGTGAVTFPGPGDVTIGGTGSTFSGPLLISGGRVDLAPGTSFGTGTFTIENNATLGLHDSRNNSRAVTIGAGGATFSLDPGTTVTTNTGIISGSAPVTLTGGGTLVLSGTGTGFTGSIIVQTAILQINGAFGAIPITVQSGGVLEGRGSTSGSMTIQSGGLIAPGDGSIGTFTVDAPITINGSYLVEFNTTQSTQLVITGHQLTLSGATVQLVALPDDYTSAIFYPIMELSGGATRVGTFQQLNNPYPLLMVSLQYPTDEVTLQISGLPFSTLSSALSPNALAVANYLDASQSSVASDFATVIGVLKVVTSGAQLNEELLQLQPSHLKGLSIAQQNDSMLVNNALSLRGISQCRAACTHEIGRKHRTEVWLDGWGDFMHQEHYQGEVGFHADAGGVVLGIDHSFTGNFYLGIAGASTFSSVDWNHSVGKGTVTSYYGLIYASWCSSHFFLQGGALGASNNYTEHRRIFLVAAAPVNTTIQRKAKGDYSGAEAGGYLSAGALLHTRSCDLSFLLSSEYYYLHQQGFHEHGADSLNLRLKSANSDLFRATMAISLSHCFMQDRSKLIPMVQVGVVREERWRGRSFHATLEGNESLYFTVYGMKPSRTLVAPLLGLTAWIYDDHCSLSIFYSGEFNANYQDQQVNLQIGCAF